MAEPKFTPGPWRINKYRSVGAGELGTAPIVAHVEPFYGDDRKYGDDDANARLIAASPDLHEAARLQEAAEDAHANCPECDGEGVPELCERCFPLFDDARLKRRAALARAEGT